MAMAHSDRWSTDDFENMSWHDAHIHGFHIVQNDAENGTAELIFDIDFILRWQEIEGQFNFVVSQALLQFHEVFDLKFVLDYVTTPIGVCPFSISGIEREGISYATGYSSYKWKLNINCPFGESKIEFTSSGFTQSLVGQPYTQEGQCLEPAQRIYPGLVNVTERATPLQP